MVHNKVPPTASQDGVQHGRAHAHSASSDRAPGARIDAAHGEHLLMLLAPSGITLLATAWLAAVATIAVRMLSPFAAERCPWTAA